MTTTTYDVIVVGAGITGLTASMRLVRQGFSVANIEASMFGGLIINVNELDGSVTGSGADLASTLMMELSDAGAATLTEVVQEVAVVDDAVTVTTEDGAHSARAVIVASGAALRRLGVPGEAEFEYKGVSQCADCDGPMCQGRDVVVVGGGDSALQEALVLAAYCRTVHIVHRGAAFRAREHFTDALARHGNIKVWWNSCVEAIVGGDTVQGVKLNAASDGTARTIACSGVFAYIGLQPRCDFVTRSVERDAQGALITDASLRTSAPAIYAAGAARSGYKGTIEDAIAEADTVANTVAQMLRERAA